MPITQHFLFISPTDVTSERISGGPPADYPSFYNEYLGNIAVDKPLVTTFGSAANGSVEGHTIVGIKNDNYVVGNILSQNTTPSTFDGQMAIKRKPTDPVGQFKIQPYEYATVAMNKTITGLSYVQPISLHFRRIISQDINDYYISREIVGLFGNVRYDDDITPLTQSATIYKRKSGGYYRLLGWALPFTNSYVVPILKNRRTLKKTTTFLVDIGLVRAYDAVVQYTNFAGDTLVAPSTSTSLKVALPINTIIVEETADSIVIAELMETDFIRLMKERVSTPLWYSDKKFIVNALTSPWTNSFDDYYYTTPQNDFDLFYNRTEHYIAAFLPAHQNYSGLRYTVLPYVKNLKLWSYGQNLPAFTSDFYDGDWAVNCGSLLTQYQTQTHHIHPLYDEMPDNDFTDFIPTGATPVMEQNVIGGNYQSQAICIRGGGTYWWDANSPFTFKNHFNYTSYSSNTYQGEIMDVSIDSPGPFETTIAANDLEQNKHWNGSSYELSPIPSYNWIKIFWIQDGVEYSWNTNFDSELVWTEGTPAITIKRAYKKFSWEDIKAQGNFNPWTCHRFRYIINTTTYNWNISTEEFDPITQDGGGIANIHYNRLGAFRNVYPYDITKTDGTISRGMMPLELKNHLDTEFSNLVRVSTGDYEVTYDDANNRLNITSANNSVEDYVQTNNYFFTPDRTSSPFRGKLNVYWRAINDKGDVYKYVIGVGLTKLDMLSSQTELNVYFNEFSLQSNMFVDLPDDVVTLEVVVDRFCKVVPKNWATAHFSGSSYYGLSWNHNRSGTSQWCYVRCSTQKYRIDISNGETNGTKVKDTRN